MIYRIKQFMSIILIVVIFCGVALVTMNPTGAATEITDLDQCVLFSEIFFEFIQRVFGH